MTQPIHTRDEFSSLGDDALARELHYFTIRVIEAQRMVAAAQMEQQAAVEGFEACSAEVADRAKQNARAA